MFAKNVQGADIKAHEKVILDSKDLKWNYMFAKNVQGADIKTLGQIVLNSKDLIWNSRFAKIDGADFEAHQKVIAEVDARRVKD